jgi:formate hydrogenlyase subunit 4
MSQSHAANGRKEREFSLPIFTLTVLAALLGLIVILGLVAPQAVWRAQVSRSSGSIWSRCSPSSS